MKIKWSVTVEDSAGTRSPLVIKSETKIGAELSALKYAGVKRVVNVIEHEKIREYKDKMDAQSGYTLSNSQGNVKGSRKTSTKAGAYAT